MTFQIFQIINNFTTIRKKMLSFREFLNENTGTTRTTVKPKNKAELFDIIKETIAEEGNNCDLNFIDTSLIDDMSELFSDFPEFNGNISGWDVSNVKKMNRMFYGSKFTGDISKWNTFKVENMKGMFMHSKFNGDISKWNTSKLKNMSFMFCFSVFNEDISKWNTSNVKTMEEMEESLLLG